MCGPARLIYSNQILGLLLYPAAVCDLRIFLDKLDEEQRAVTPEVGERLSGLLQRLGLPISVHHARECFGRVYGYLAKAV